MNDKGKFYTVLGIGLAYALAVVAVAFCMAKAHADPADFCGTGKFYNQYSNTCNPTDRGATPNPVPHYPGSNDGRGGWYAP